MSIHKEVLVLFSGGRDSSSTAVELAVSGYKVKLFTYQAGFSELTGPRGDSAPDIRHLELTRAFPNSINDQRIIESNAYLIRKLALEKINKEHVVYPIALALAVHTSAICFCLKNNIDIIASGYSGYQSKKERYIEQGSNFVTLTKEFLKYYSISYLTPVIEKTEQEVKDILERYGISSNSLENKSLFGGIGFNKEEALAFWESSIPLCKEFIKNRQINILNRNSNHQ